jgi:pimeloyl-ACP methyl ester carboxylesterase
MVRDHRGNGGAGFAVVGGRRLEVARYGPSPERAPTLVFLHEGLGSVSTWRDFPQRLADACGFGALVYSRAGYGRSSPVTLPRPLTYMQDEAKEALPHLLDAEGVRACVLVGHSDGASIALVHAGTPLAHSRVRGLLLEAPHVFTESGGLASIAQTKEAFERGDLRARLAKHHDDVDVAFWGWNRAWLDPHFRAWNIEAFLPAIEVPALVIQGTDDEYGSLAQVDAIERGIGSGKGGFGRAIFGECGHAPHRDQPELTLAAMTGFVRALGLV